MPDVRTVQTFYQAKSPLEVLELDGSHPDKTALLGEMSLDCDPFITVARPAGDGGSVFLLRRIKVDTVRWSSRGG